MFYYIITGVLIVYFGIVIFAVIERMFENQQESDEEFDQDECNN